MSAFDAMRKRVSKMLAHIEHIQLLERMKHAVTRLPETWVRLDSEGNAQVVYDSRHDMHNQEPDGSLATLGIGTLVHPKEYVIDDGPDGWNPDMGFTDAWDSYPEGLPPSIPTD